jgi:uncharacterized protein (DUF427 family)
MTHSPGHQKWPDHHVTEHAVGGRMTVRVNGELVADSSSVTRVDEDGAPPRFYFPRNDVKVDKLHRSATTTECPYKGTARYFDLDAGGASLHDAVWSYEQPYDEHRGLAGRLAFYDDKNPDIEVRAV